MISKYEKLYVVKYLYYLKYNKCTIIKNSMEKY